MTWHRDKNMKLKLLLGLGLAPVAVFAEGGTTVSSAVSQLQTAATDAIDAVAPAVVAVLVALFVIVGAVFAYKKITARLGR